MNENIETNGVFLSSIPLDKLVVGIGDYVLSKLTGNSEKFQPESKNTSWLTHTEAAAYLKKSSAALYKLSSMRAVKFSKRGKSNFYRIADLEKYLEAGLIRTSDEIVKEVCLTPRKKHSITKS